MEYRARVNLLSDRNFMMRYLDSLPKHTETPYGFYTSREWKAIRLQALVNSGHMCKTAAR